jgi:hypothetical protein
VDLNNIHGGKGKHEQQGQAKGRHNNTDPATTAATTTTTTTRPTHGM